jgi:hypothetical protein
MASHEHDVRSTDTVLDKISIARNKCNEMKIVLDRICEALRARVEEAALFLDENAPLCADNRGTGRTRFEHNNGQFVQWQRANRLEISSGMCGACVWQKV